MIREEAIKAVKEAYGNSEYTDEIIKALKQEPMLDKVRGYINHIRNTGWGKKKSLEFIEKYIDGLKAESERIVCQKRLR